MPMEPRFIKLLSQLHDSVGCYRSDVLRTRLDAGHPVEKVLAAWDEEAQGFAAEAKRYYLYT